MDNERQTGATDETAMRLRSWSQKAGISNGESWEEISDRRKEQWRQLARQCEQSGQVITDAERVPTDDELAEWRRLVGGADEGYVDLPSLDVLRAYLERQR